MLFVVKIDVLSNPVDISFFGIVAIFSPFYFSTNLVK